MSIIEQYTAAADQAHSVAERFTGLFTQGARTFTEQIDVSSTLPDIDPAPVKGYYHLLQQALDAQRQFTLQWIDGVNSVAGFLRQQAGTVTSLLGN